MGSFANNLTSPIGVKLFKGGNYSDSGHGDQAQKAQQQGSQQISQLIAQLAHLTGVQNPQAQQNPMYPNGGNPSDPASSQDPFSLNPAQQGALNQQNSLDSEAMNRIMSKAKANLAARGLGDSSSMKAAEAYLKQKMVGQISSNQQQAGQNAYNSRLNAISQIGNLVNGQTAGAVNMQQQLGQQATQEHNQSMSQLGGLLGFATGGGFGGGRTMGTPPIRQNLGGTTVQSGNSGPAGQMEYGDLPAGQWGNIYQNWGGS